MSLGLLFSAIIAPAVLSKRVDVIGKRSAMALGFILGIGIATKVTFAPLAAYIFLLPSGVSILLACIVTVLAFVAFTNPIWDAYPKMWHWIERLFAHSGPYGSVESALPSTETFGHNIWNGEIEDFIANLSHRDISRITQRHNLCLLGSTKLSSQENPRLKLLLQTRH